MSTLRTCRKCGGHAEHGTDRSRADGVAQYCRACTRARMARKRRLEAGRTDPPRTGLSDSLRAYLDAANELCRSGDDPTLRAVAGKVGVTHEAARMAQQRLRRLGIAWPDPDEPDDATRAEVEAAIDRERAGKWRPIPLRIYHLSREVNRA